MLLWIRGRGGEFPCSFSAPNLTIGAASLSLSLAAAIYIVWRTRSLVLFEAIDLLGLSQQVSLIRDSLQTTVQPPSSWVVYSLPAGLWVFGCSCLVLVAYRSSQIIQRIGLTLVLAISSFLELGQLIGCVPGTFDPVDLLAIASGSGGVWVILHLRSTTFLMKSEGSLNG